VSLCISAINNKLNYLDSLLVEFYVLWVVHLGKILVNDQLEAQFFFLVCLFQLSTFFEQPRAHHQENQFINTKSVICHLHRVTYTRLCIDTINSPDDEHEVARNM
jgi:hypothetical protein